VRYVFIIEKGYGMKSAMHFFYIILLFSIFVGCSSSPLTRYPDFLERKSKFTSTVILSDVIVINASLGDSNIIDLVDNQKIAKITLQLFAGKMNEKGYNIDRVFLSSIGLLLNKDVNYRIIRTPEEQLFEPSELEVASPPLYLHELFSQDTIRRQLLRLVYSSLLNYEKRKGDNNIKIPAATYLSQSLGGGMLGVIFVSGYNVGATKQYGQYLSPFKTTEEKISIQPISQFSMMFYLIDSSNGEVIWDDRVIVKGGLMHSEKLQKMVEKLCDELP